MKPPPLVSPDLRRPPFAPSLIAPLVTAAAVVGLLGVARIFEYLPLRPPPCGLRTLTGIPCIGCGGTRALKALAQGDLFGAFAFNPLVILGALAALVWPVAAWIRHRHFPHSRPFPAVPLPWIISVVVVLLAVNWIYLILFLPE